MLWQYSGVTVFSGLRFKTIRGKLLGVLLSAIVLSLIFVFSLFAAASYRSGHDALNQRLESHVETQADAIAVSLWHYDHATLNAIMKAFARDADFLNAFVRDRDGDIIVSTGIVRDDDSLSQIKATHSVVHSTATGPQEIGSLEVSYRLDGLRAELIERILIDGFELLVLIVVIVAVIVIATNRMIGVPLSRLMQSITSQRQQMQRQAVDWHSDDEFGELVRAYNELQLVQTSTEQSLQQANEFLQQEIAEREHAEEVLRQSQKMQALGQLTGGVAHDFNNLLAIIYSSSELLGEQTGESGKMLDNIQRAAQRGADLTSRLLTFSRQQALEPKTIDLNAHVTDMTEVLRRTLGENVRVEMLAGEDLWYCECDPGQLENAILNFALNARDAMPEGGVLAIKTFNQRLDEKYAATQSEVDAGEYVALCVTDNGCGMSQSVAERAFEPFYTTKGLGEGTGLGLSMAFGFAKQSCGHITIDSEQGLGTVVTLYLPRSHSEPQPVDVAQVQPTTDNGSHSILVVEDDPDVRSLICSMVESLGYRVHEAADSDAAMNVLTANPEVSLMLSDVMLAGPQSGPQLAGVAQKTLPGLKVVFMSGYTDEAISGHRELGRQPLLRKPFRKHRLTEVLNEVLGSGAP